MDEDSSTYQLLFNWSYFKLGRFPNSKLMGIVTADFRQNTYASKYMASMLTAIITPGAVGKHKPIYDSFYYISQFFELVALVLSINQ